MNIRIFPTNEALDEAAGALFADLLRAKPQAVLGLATGGTPVGIYEQLIRLHRAGEVQFREATTFNLDEYVGLPENHIQSYHTYMHEHLFAHIDMVASRIHILDGNAADLQQECLQFDQLLREAEQIDLQILGIGHNGHIGFNEPGSSLVSGTHVVELSQATRLANARFFAGLEEVPRQAITMGVSEIIKAKCVLLVVRGAEKAKIVYEALTGPITTEVPASLLQVHPNLIVMLDAKAGVLFNG